MTTVSISRLKASLSEYLDVVRSGEPVVITDRGEPVARIVPFEGLEDAEERRARLIREGIVEPASERRSRPLTPPPGKKPSGVLAALLEERAEGR